MTLYHKLKSMQSDKTDNRNIFMKGYNKPTLYIFERQEFCGDKVYTNSRTGGETSLAFLIEVAFLDYKCRCANQTYGLRKKK